METFFDIWHLIADFARGVLVINVLLWGTKFKSLPQEIKVLGIFLIIDLVTEFLASWTSSRHINNMPLLHIYTILEFVAFSLFYRVLFQAEKRFQQYFWHWMVFWIALLMVNSAFIESIFKFNSNAKTTVQIILIGYAVAYFFKAYGKADFSKPLPFALAMINAGVVLYYSGSLFVFMFSKFLNDPVHGISLDAQVGFWLLNSLLFFTFQILILTALCRTLFTRKQSSSL